MKKIKEIEEKQERLKQTMGGNKMEEKMITGDLKTLRKTEELILDELNKVAGGSIGHPETSGMDEFFPPADQDEFYGIKIK